MIPKIIHQTYCDYNLAPDIQRIVHELKARNPNWDYRFYTDIEIERYIQTHFDASIWQVYSKINPVYGAAKADLFRYLVLWNEGGIYLDIKSSCIYPLDEVIKPDDTFIVTQWQNDCDDVNKDAGKSHRLLNELNLVEGEYQQWVLICEKKSPIMWAVVQSVIKNIQQYRPWHYKFHSYGKRGVLNVTGPIAYTMAVHKLKNKYPIRFERYDKNLGLVYNALECSHTKVLPKHYSNYKTYIVNQGFWHNQIFNLYIMYIRLAKSALKSVGKWQA